MRRSRNTPEIDESASSSRRLWDGSETHTLLAGLVLSFSNIFRDSVFVASAILMVIVVVAGGVADCR